MPNKIIVPVKIGEKLKFPLHKIVLLFMTSGKIYSCRIIYAGKDFIKVNNVQERIIDQNNKVKYIDLQLPENTIFNRNKIEGYSPNEHNFTESDKDKCKLVSIKTKKGRDRNA